MGGHEIVTKMHVVGQLNVFGNDRASPILLPVEDIYQFLLFSSGARGSCTDPRRTFIRGKLSQSKEAGFEKQSASDRWMDTNAVWTEMISSCGRFVC